MRICWLVDNLGHYHAARMRALLDARRHDLSVVEVDGRAGFREFGADAAAVEGLPLRTLFGPGRSRIGLMPLRGALYQALDAVRPDVLFVNGWSQRSAVLAMAWAGRHQCPFVVVSDSTAADRARSGWKEAMKRELLRPAAAAFVAGSRHSVYVQSLGVPARRVFLGYDVVDTAHFARGAERARQVADQARAVLHLPERYILAVARLLSRKGIDTLLEALAWCRSRGDATAPWLVVAGDGPERERLMALARAHGVADRCQFRGYVGYPDLPALYGLAIAAVLASTSEPWGLVVNEAMASATAVLVSNACGCADDLVQSGRNGFVFRPGDIAGLGAYIARLSGAPAEARAMGLQAREDVAAWGLDRFVSGCWSAAEAARELGSARWSRLGTLGLESLAFFRPESA